MIRPDMKVGDIFDDGELKFEVLEVLEDGMYISKRIGDATIISTPKSTDKKQTEIVTNNVEPILDRVEEVKPEITPKTPTKTSVAKKTTTTRKTVAKKTTKK